MEEKEMSVGKKILLWIAVLPASILVYLLIYWGNILMGKLWFNSAFAIDVIATIFANLVTPFIAAKIAPNGKKAVIIILCLLIAISTGFSTYITLANPDSATVKLVILQVAGIISALCPIVFVWKHTEEDFKEF